MIFQEFKDNHGAFTFLVVSFQSSDFLDTKSRIRLSVMIAKFYPFVCHSVPYSHYELQFRFVMKLKFEQPKNSGEMSSITLKVSWKVKEFVSDSSGDPARKLGCIFKMIKWNYSHPHCHIHFRPVGAGGIGGCSPHFFVSV